MTSRLFRVKMNMFRYVCRQGKTPLSPLPPRADGEAGPGGHTAGGVSRVPKQIENLRLQLLEEARRQTAEQGYGKTTVRSVAAACGIAVGTVYNYFPSKEVLIASFVAEDWAQSLAQMRAISSKDPETCLRGIYEALRSFMGKHRVLFSDPEAARAASAGYLPRHLQLREQLAELTESLAPSEDGFDAQFLAEALLTWTVAGKPFDRIYDILKKLIIKYQ